VTNRAFYTLLFALVFIAYVLAVLFLPP